MLPPMALIHNQLYNSSNTPTTNTTPNPTTATNTSAHATAATSRTGTLPISGPSGTRTVVVAAPVIVLFEMNVAVHRHVSCVCVAE